MSLIAKVLARPTHWKILTSRGIAVHVGKFIIGGMSGGSLFISQKDHVPITSEGVSELKYAGLGLGVSVPNSGLPVDASYSTIAMPSHGQVYHGLLSNGDDLTVEDLTGPCAVLVIGASAGLGCSKTMFFLGTGPSPIPFFCKAVGVVVGWNPSTPGISMVEYRGYMRWSHVNRKLLKSTDIVHHEARDPHFQFAPPAMTLPADVLFDFDRSNLKTAAEPALREAAQLIQKQKLRSVIIEGHTDSKGSDEYNVGLSTARANAVKHWMIQRRVPLASSFVTRGMGKGQPIADNVKRDGSDNPEGRRKNRRVSIFLVR